MYCQGLVVQVKVSLNHILVVLTLLRYITRGLSQCVLEADLATCCQGLLSLLSL